MDVHGFTVYDMIARGAFVYGDAPAILHGDRRLSFREFRRQVDALAGGLLALGIGKGDRICVLAQNDTAYLELYGACARQGIVAYPINWRLTAQEVERVVDRAAPRMMVVDASTLPLLALPLFHIPALGGAMAHMHAGAASVLVSRFDAEEAVRLIDRHSVTHVSDFPPVLTNLLDAAEKLGSRLPSLKHVSGLDAPQTIQRLHEQTRAQSWSGVGQSGTRGL